MRFGLSIRRPRARVVSARTAKLCALGLLAFAPAATAQTDSPSLSLERRAWIASKIYASVQTYFAHWEGVPGLDLDAAYRVYLAEAVRNEDRLAFDLATMEFMAKLKNGHSSFSDAWLWDTHGQPLGFVLSELDGAWVVTVSRLPALEVGDVVSTVDGLPTAEFLTDRMRFVAASSDWARRLRLFSRPFLFPARLTIGLAEGRKVLVHRGQQELAPAPRREMEKKELAGGIPYLYIPSFEQTTMEAAAVEFIEEHAAAPVMIIDVRGNGGGTTPTKLIEAVMDRPYRDWMESSLMTVGLFGAYRRVAEIADPDQLSEYVRGYVDAFSGFDHNLLMIPGTLNEPRDPAFTGQLIVLADDGCASACENFLLPLKTGSRATIVGQNTRGSTGQPYLYQFEDGMSFRVSAKRVFFPDGSTFEGVGITPDVRVEPSLEDLRNGRDPALDRAVQLAQSSSGD